MNIKFSPPDITQKEIDGVISALMSGWITTGPKTKLFENEIAKYCGTKKAVALNSATACMEIALKVLGVGEGDEVITSSYTYTASASVIQHTGAKIVLADVGQDSYEMDYDALEQLITKKTKVIIPVDIAGVPCDYNRIFDALEKKRHLFRASNDIQKIYNRVIVLSDSAHSFGARLNGKINGSIADFTSFSFHAVKNLTTAEGGAITWKSVPGIDDDAIYKEFMLWSLHGQSKDALSKVKLGSWEYDIERLGYKCNMTDIAAAIGLVQLERYPTILQRRKQIIEMYNNGLNDLPVKLLSHYEDLYTSSGHLYLTRIEGVCEKKRGDIIAMLAEKGIPANVHYKPLPMLTAYKRMGFKIENYPNSYNQYKNEISLPLHTLLTDKEVFYIIEEFRKIISTFKK